VHFRNDVYGIDRRQAALVAERTGRLKKAGAGATVHTATPRLQGRTTD
jgi:hypothetical protein